MKVPVSNSVWASWPHSTALSPSAFVRTAQSKQGPLHLPSLGLLQGPISAWLSPCRTTPLGERTACVGLTMAPALSPFLWAASPPTVCSDQESTYPHQVPSTSATALFTVGCLHPVSASSFVCVLLRTLAWLRKWHWEERYWRILSPRSWCRWIRS